MKSILDTFRVGDDLPIESKPVSDTLDKVQQQVESYYYDTVSYTHLTLPTTPYV